VAVHGTGNQYYERCHARIDERLRAMEIVRKMRAAVSMCEWKDARAWPGRCPLCGPSIIVQFNASAVGVRCVRCSASAITMSHVSVLQKEIGSLAGLHVYELSSRGPLLRWLRRYAGQVTCSEYFDGVDSGALVNGVQCQDVQRMTYGCAVFDVCTSTEVLEHVPDDALAFSELHRVLRPGGRLVFSVPMSSQPTTVERAKLVNGVVKHLLSPEFHGDRIRGQGRVLAYRNYGKDILSRVEAAGFNDVRLAAPTAQVEWLAQQIVVATA
jgi:SAM-dependent methyltransferase